MSHVPPQSPVRPAAAPSNPPPRKGLSGCAIAGIGCGVIVLLALLGIAIGVWWLSNNWRGLVATTFGSALKQSVQESGLPDDQKQRIVARVDTLIADYKAGRITEEQIGTAFNRLTEGPLLYIGALLMLEQNYVQLSQDLSNEEKEAARLTLQRVARGIHEGSLSRDVVGEVTAPITQTNAEGEPELQETATTDQVRQMLTIAEEKADAAGVPEEPWQINWADEFDRVVDGALAAPDPDATPVEAAP